MKLCNPIPGGCVEREKSFVSSKIWDGAATARNCPGSVLNHTALNLNTELILQITSYHHWRADKDLKKPRLPHMQPTLAG